MVSTCKQITITPPHYFELQSTTPVYIVDVLQNLSEMFGIYFHCFLLPRAKFLYAQNMAIPAH
jgi:hypothetical protein